MISTSTVDLLGQPVSDPFSRAGTIDSVIVIDTAAGVSDGAAMPRPGR